DVVGMHVVPVAIQRAFAHLYQRGEDAHRAVAFIDIGAATTTMLIAHGTSLVFAKSIQAAGDQVTRQYAAAHQLGFAEARAARMGQTAVASGGGVAVAERGAPPAATDMAQAVDVLLDEVQLCMRYYQRRYAD